ncbi:ubiquitin carboxyl-terminal hydrolase 14 [Cenococcum geophilum 1.58]|uniref:ubiquitin carboxyl-terminal hydrolase 14 n=1 Tax=Cenococcum geophilum 1.58 TaxID=794803 RepID=UPI00358E765B|nr:ubiquitin carboxyl-terminal hydrolase 14 [Cenococcum geophilum 1.58]
MACVHVDSPDLRPPGPNQSVYREDCTQCFDSIDDPSGLDVCLFCFNGGCTGERSHSLLHVASSKHPLVLNIKRTQKKVKRDEPPQKISKLAIAAVTEADRYDTTTQVKCYECGIDDVDRSSGKLSQVVDTVLKANTFARQEEVKAWEQELTACEHTLCLEQDAPRDIESQNLGHCSICDLKENLWLCLTCGNLGCGRAQFGGIGGNSHGVAHTSTTGHPIAVKLGSLTADGTADIYCYACDEERVDPELPTHLAHWGINIKDRVKTEKSLTEMQVEHNLLYEFSMTTGDGKELKPLFGSGFTGLKNLGNSCYLASVLQSLFSMPEFADRYYLPGEALPNTSTPAEDIETQLRKIADGLLSGRYSKPDSDVIVSEHTPEVPHQKGLAPAMLKHLIGRGHVEFSTMRQQDAFELLLHLLKLITRSQHPSPLRDPVEAFRFVMEQRLQCLNCKKVRYRTDEQENLSIPVPIKRIPKEAKMEIIDAEGKEAEKEEFESVTLKECLDIFTGDEIVELTCSSCGSKDGFSKRSLFKTFPAVLAVNARRFKLVNWVPTKQDVPVLVGDEPFSFDAYKSHGLRDDEELLPEDADAGSAPKWVPNEAALSMLEAMGFPRVHCEKALHATGNSDPDAASNWLFSHMEDPDIDTPMDFGGGSRNGTAGGSTTVDPDKIESLCNMGFNTPQARQALKETNGDLERAVDWLFNHPDAAGDFDEGNGSKDAPDVTVSESKEKTLPGSPKLPVNFQLQSIVCHKGSSIHAGHYVAFIRKQIPDENSTSWVLFNDEKVAKAADVDEMKKFAYVYFFRRL